jgi:hypothetical protein
VQQLHKRGLDTITVGGKERLIPKYMNIEDAKEIAQRAQRVHAQGHITPEPDYAQVFLPTINTDGSEYKHYHANEDYYRTKGDNHALAFLDNLDTTRHIAIGSKKSDSRQTAMQHYHKLKKADRHLEALRKTSPYLCGKERDYYMARLHELRRDTLRYVVLHPSERRQELEELEKKVAFWEVEMKKKMKTLIRYEKWVVKEASKRQTSSAGSSSEVSRGVYADEASLMGSSSGRDENTAIQDLLRKEKTYEILASQFSGKGDLQKERVAQEGMVSKDRKMRAFTSAALAKLERDHYGHLAEDIAIQLAKSVMPTFERASLEKQEAVARQKYALWRRRYDKLKRSDPESKAMREALVQ